MTNPTKKMWGERIAAARSNVTKFFKAVWEWGCKVSFTPFGVVFWIVALLALWVTFLLQASNYIMKDKFLDYEEVQSQSPCIKDELHTRYINVGIAATTYHLKKAKDACKARDALSRQKGNEK